MKILALMLIVLLFNNSQTSYYSERGFIDIPVLIANNFFGSKPTEFSGSDNEIAVKIKEKCDSSDVLLCYAKEFDKLSYQRGYKFAFSTLAELQGIDKRATDCHFIAHSIGYGEFKRNQSMMFNSENSECSYGFSMGILERYVQNVLKEGIFQGDALKKLCPANAPSQCFHILGHMVISESYGYLNFSIEQCDRLEKPFQKYYCHTGVFMEMVTPRTLVDHGITDKSKLNVGARMSEHKAMCDSYEREKQIACYGELAAAVRYNSTDEIFRFCDLAPSRSASLECKKHTITIIAIDFNLEPGKMAELCNLENTSGYKTACYERLVSTILAIKGPPRKSDAEEFCKSVAEKEKCFSYLNKKLVRIKLRDTLQ